jgi:hypothetical protein
MSDHLVSGGREKHESGSAQPILKLGALEHGCSRELGDVAAAVVDHAPVLPRRALPGLVGSGRGSRSWCGVGFEGHRELATQVERALVVVLDAPVAAIC